MACTRYDVLCAAAKYDGSPTAHEDVMATLKKHGHAVKASDAWCTETVMAILYDAGGKDLVGGYAADSGTLKSHAQKKGLWHAGTKGMLPGDICIYGSGGKPNHTELCIGSADNLSGNYNKGCSRRKRARSTLMGYISPKYAVTPKLDNLGITILAAETILGAFGSGSVRKIFLDALKNREAVQAEVDRVWDDTGKTVFDLMAYVIAGHAGKDKYRRTRLGSWADAVQSAINDLAELAGKPDRDAAQDVLDGKYGTGAVRRLLLAFNGYDAAKVQAEVNAALERPQGGKEAEIISLFRDKPRGTKEVDGLQGNCVIIRQDGCALVIDTMLSGALDKITAEIADCKTVDLYLSHMHGDHTGNAAKLLATKRIRKLYIQARETVHSDYRSRYDAILKAAQKAGTEVVVLKNGSTFSCGTIYGGVAFQQDGTDSVNMRSLCTFFAVAEKGILYCGDHHAGAKESKLSFRNHVDVYISSHHGLYTGDKEAFIKQITPDWIIRAGWKSWPLGTVGQDAKTKAADAVYQKYGNLLPGDVCGRTVLTIGLDGAITASAERSMIGKTIKYTKDGKTYQKTVHVCGKCSFKEVASMVPTGGRIV